MEIGIYNLQRYPIIKNDPLQAWSSADELILDHLKTYDLVGKRIIILNDSFGALSVGLQKFDLTVYTDSFVSSEGIKFNSKNQIQPIFKLTEFSGTYDFVLIQLPKNLSFFEDQLMTLTNHLKASSEIICMGMVKHMAKGHFDLIEKYIGKTKTSLAIKKARLVFATFEKESVDSLYPKEIALDGFQKNFTHHSNIFSREKLDIGTRFFLEYIPQTNAQSILDLGCGNGVVGIKAKELNPSAKIYFADESYMAIQSAKTNYNQYYSDEASMHWTNCFENGETELFDLVLCNPPFHQNNTIGDFIALDMFADAKRSLIKGGVLRVIGNSHLAYQVKLKKIFGNSTIIKTNKKFMIIDSIKK